MTLTPNIPDRSTLSPQPLATYVSLAEHDSPTVSNPPRSNPTIWFPRTTGEEDNYESEFTSLV